MASFFDQPLKQQIEAAIDNDDPKLVQVLLGPKYCQLWQYWLVHGVVISKTLNMERITQVKLSLSIIEKQEKILQEQKKLLETRKKFLKDNDGKSIQGTGQANQIKKSGNLMRDLLIATKDATVECKDAIVEESNKQISCGKFYIPQELLNGQDSSGELKYVIQEINTISSAEALSLTNEIDSVISEIKKQINSDIWKQSDIGTRTSYYLGKVVERIESNGQLLDQATNTIPENMEVGGRKLPIKAIVKIVVAGLRIIPSGALKLMEITCDNINSLACIEDNLKEIDRFTAEIKKIKKEKQDLNNKLIATRDKIESQVIERMNDGKFINKQFVTDMYKAFLYNYLSCACNDSSNLLYNDIKEEKFNIKVLVDRILKREVDYREFEDFLPKAMSKKNHNLDVISVLIVNSAPLRPYKCTDPDSNAVLQKLMARSFHTVMIDVHNLLFDFDRHFPDIDVDVSLLSSLPNRDGSYSNSCKNNIILQGNTKYKSLLKEVMKFISEIDELEEKGGLNRVRGYVGIPFMWYKFYDFSRSIFSSSTPSSSGECSRVINEKIKEFLQKAMHSIATGNEGMMKEYIEDVKERMKCEKNSDVRELYHVVSGDRWRDKIFRRKGWSEASKEQGLERFIDVTSKRVNEFATIQEQRGRILAEQRAERLAIENATIKSFRNLKKKSLDSALRDIVEDSEDEIVEAVVQHVMEHNSSPEQVLDSIIEEIKCNKTQVLREGTVNAELIKLGIESFLNQGSSLSNVSILQDVNVNHVAQGSGMSRNP